MGHDTSDLTTVREKEVSLIGEIYDRSSLSLAIDECDPAALQVVVAKQSENATLVRFSDPSGTPPDDTMIRDFLNRVLDLSVRVALQDSQT